MRISDWSSDVCSSDLRQLVRAGDHWHERLVACQDTLFLPIGGPPLPADVIPEHLRDAPHGAVLETAPAAVAVMRALAARLAAPGGAALVVDYGYDGTAPGDTLQAVRGHGYVHPFEAPGEHDLTAHRSEKRRVGKGSVRSFR